MGTAIVLKFFVAFVFVISLMLLLSWAVKHFGLTGAVIKVGNKRRLKMVEYLPLDQRRRLVLFRRDDKEYLMVLGPNRETIIDADIEVLEAANVVDLPVQNKKEV